MTQHNVDVIIVGLGPVGAYLAWQAASRGLNVLGLERAAAGAPASDIGVFHFEDIAFDRTGVPRPKPEEIVCRYDEVYIHAPDARHVLHVPGVVTWALDLSAFIANLRRLAKDAGATLKYGVAVEDLLRDRGRVVGVRARTRRGEAEFTAPVVVDATGLARALRRRDAMMDYPGANRALSVYMEYWREATPPLPDGIHSFVGPNAWIARYPGYWIVGMGGVGPLAETRAAHAAWVKSHPWSPVEIQRAVTGAIPYASPPPTLVDDGLVVVGDAAATNKPFNGEGISSGMALARIVAEHLPVAVRGGGDRASLWDINRRYFTGQGAKFAFLHAMGKMLLDLTDDEQNVAFEIGLIAGEDLRQTFYHYEVKKPLTEWLLPAARLLRRGRLARKYGAAILRATQAGRLYEAYPRVEEFDAWLARFKRLPTLN